MSTTTSLFLRVIGQPTIVLDGAPVTGLRKKDIALAIYLWHSAPRRHGRGLLAALLWGDSTERRARHSLTQSLARLQSVLPSTFEITRADVQWTAAAASDIEDCLRSSAKEIRCDDPIFTGEAAFLSGFQVGEGGDDFQRWAEEVRSAYHTRAVQTLDFFGAKAEDAHDWKAAIRFSEAGIRLDSFAEAFHRRLMRSYAARGERNLAARHYSELCVKWRRELDRDPDPATEKLSKEIAAGSSEIAAESAGNDRAPIVVAGLQGSDHQESSVADPPFDRAKPNGPAAAPVSAIGDGELVEPRAPRSQRIGLVGAIGIGIVLAAVGYLAWFKPLAVRSKILAYPQGPFRIHGDTLVYFAWGQLYWAYPNRATFRVCSEGQSVDDRELAPPLLFGGVLPSVHDFPWLATESAVTSVDDPTVYIIRRCIRRGVPSPQVLRDLIGDDPWSKVIVVDDTILRKIPFGLSADLAPIITPIRRLKNQPSGDQPPTPTPFRSPKARLKEQAAKTY